MVMHTEFFRKSVSPSLGFHPSATEAPHIWKSFMTDDHTPVELSWCWSAAKDTPKVRYSVEAISRSAAQGTDLVNAAANVRLLGDSLSIAPDMDLYLHRHFRNLLSSRHITQQTDATLQREVPQSQCFIAFDLLEKGMVVKQYYLPGQTAVREGSSNWNIIKHATRKLSGPAVSLLASFDVLVSFIESLPAESRATVEILAIDCLEPIKSRLKVYIRTVDTTFHSVLHMLTLGANEVLPKSKVYLPVRHYAQNDDQIAKGLSNYLEHRRKKLSTGSYYHAVQKLCNHRNLADGLGFHTYISWASENNQWNVTAYFNPEIYASYRSG
ncbi:tryptophan dimethylallyltransferase domain-containing protein [Trichoderma breve]|uniref:Tryptophan dimethylallyltransferase domain-containing protein n=1 Tax=Trichoderma breve TaxID=2034170 RepID=A0A9W9E216_9HYPO|nr:tryptophan dimethylallyltransferase domain-containing protein [Trichoderma breve]KAJ4854539.1 tryptophan dimethylallyltransferase domain-containing protein [Trichoderma breve]